MVAWSRDAWSVLRIDCRQFSVTINFQSSESSGLAWSLAAVYGPVLDALKPNFLAELRLVQENSTGMVLICGDFNLIYLAADKNNDRLNLASMRHFRRSLDAMGIEELYVHGMLYTWSNERRRPTMERMDRAFATVQWLEEFADHRCGCYPRTPLTMPRSSCSCGLNHGPRRGSILRHSGFASTALTMS